MSDRAKLVLASLRLKLMVAVSPLARLALLLVTMMVGGVVSARLGVLPPVPAGRPRLRVTLLLGSAPSLLALPAASVNRSLSTPIRPLLAPAVGVKVAM